MKVLLRILLILLILVLLVVLYFGLTGEKNYTLERSVTIDAPVEFIFPYATSLKKMTIWSPWAEKDANVKNTWEGNDGEVGSANIWEGNDAIGSGKQTITKIEENRRVETALEFYKPYEDEASAYFDFEGDRSKTKVTWGLTGENGFMERVMMGLMSVDLEKEVGPEYEKGLAKLKKIAEGFWSNELQKREAERIKEE